LARDWLGIRDMNFLVLEGGVLVVTFLLGCEWRRQQWSWRDIVLGASIVLAVMNAMIIAWRGL
jgi:hypothetical protein